MFFGAVCLFDSVGLIENKTGIYRSTDLGANWALVRAMKRVTSYGALARSGSLALAGADSAMFLSHDGGLTWTPDSVRLPCRYINSIVFDPPSTRG